MRKPRGFNHQYIYVDERKEKLAKMEENAKRDLGMLPEKEFNPEDIRGKFVEGTTHLKRRKASGRKPVSFGIILIIIIPASNNAVNRFITCFICYSSFLSHFCRFGYMHVYIYMSTSDTVLL